MPFGKTNPATPPPSRRVAISVVLHCAVLGLVMYKGRSFIAPMQMPGDTHGTQLTLTYLPGRAPQAASVSSSQAVQRPASPHETKLASPTLQPTPTVQPASAEPQQAAVPPPNTNNSPASTNPDSATGADSLGTGNINIAYLDSFRSPRPDLSSMPRGVSGDVVLAVTIDAAGRIVALKKLSGVGYGIDESVIATVQAWVFHPATKDGTPVASEQELHFHYERGRNG